MATSASPSVVILSAPDTLPGVDAVLRRSGVRPHRILSVVPRAVAPSVWLERLAGRPPPDTVVVTSRVAVDSGLGPWRRSVGRCPRGLQVWAVGPGTAEAVRRVGIRRVLTPRKVGSAALAESVGRGAPRRILYFRSDRAGTDLARSLRARGHRVVDLIVYRLHAPPPLTTRDRRELLAATLLVVTSPSGVVELRRRLGRPAFARLSTRARLVVLGERSLRTSRGLGFRDVSVAPSTTAQRFVRHLLAELRHART